MQLDIVKQNLSLVTHEAVWTEQGADLSLIPGVPVCGRQRQMSNTLQNIL